MSQDILAWHGAPNLAAICLLGWSSAISPCS